MTTAWFPLRRRLLALMLGGVSICWLVMLVWSYHDTHGEINELMDGQLVLEAQTLLALAAHEADEMQGQTEDDEAGHDEDNPTKNLRFQIWTRDGLLVQKSPGIRKTPLTASDGFSNVPDPEGKHPNWRYFSQWTKDGEVRVIVGENDHVREDLISHTIQHLLLPAILGLPILGTWVWLAIRQGLRPLNVVAEEIAAREPDHLNALKPATAPEEIRPLIESINHLFARVEQTLESEKRFTADAAHELRTPLAALATQAQVAMRARNESERGHAFDQLIASSRRAARLVDQLLTLARLDPSDPASVTTVELDRLAEDVCALHGMLAIENNVTLELDADPARVAGDADMLRILLRNLIDNAIRYTPSGGRVLVEVKGTTLSVTDSGPGIPASEREWVFDRFHRLAGQESEGSGLGLSIVARIAERHGATIRLADGVGSACGAGLRVSVEFPAV
jgi:two-component system sensor histidine kinase QseC